LREPEDHVTVAETSNGGGGGAVIVGVVATALSFFVLFFMFGEHIFSDGDGTIDVNVNAPKVDALAEQ
jgi:formiminotetrahydrofolate cyclodeaminase